MREGSVGSRRRRVSAGTGWFLAGYAGLAGFLALETLTRKPGDASNLTTSIEDQGSTRTIITAYALGATLPLLLRRLPVPRLPPAAAPVGLTVQAAGLVLRTWSMHTLGTSYTRTLRTDGRQRLVAAGPYRLVRHPGYTGSLMIWTGFALTSRDLPTTAVIATLLGRAYQRRIRAEEELLRRDLSGYIAYSQRTKKLVPLGW